MRLVKFRCVCFKFVISSSSAAAAYCLLLCICIFFNQYKLDNPKTTTHIDNFVSCDVLIYTYILISFIFLFLNHREALQLAVPLYFVSFNLRFELFASQVVSKKNREKTSFLKLLLFFFCHLISREAFLAYIAAIFFIFFFCLLPCLVIIRNRN